MRASQAARSWESWGGRLDGVSGVLGIPPERRVSLTLTTMLVAAVGVIRTLLRRLLALAIAVSARSIRQPRRVLHCSRHVASKRTMSSERSSA